MYKEKYWWEYTNKTQYVSKQQLTDAKQHYYFPNGLVAGAWSLSWCNAYSRSRKIIYLL
jgi:hypothetical protein